MAKLKQEFKESFMDRLTRKSKEFNETHPIIKIMYRVLEVRPEYNTGGYYDRDVPEERKPASDWVNSEEEANQFIAKHHPDKGNYFVIEKNYLRKVPETTRWYPY